MALSDFEPDTITVAVGNKTTFDVRGLSFIDLSSIMRTHFNDLEHLFELYEKEAGQDISNISMARYATALIKDAPGLVAHLIALAADEPEMVNRVHRLPLLSQVDALRAIGKLTFEEVGGVKKLIRMIADLASELRDHPESP